MAFKTFANGFPLPASDLNNFLMKQSVIVFADVAARTAALPEPVEGMVTYLEDDNELYKWTGADWVNIAAPSPVTTEGDLIIGDAGGDETRLPIGAADRVLTSNGTTATWEEPAGGGGMELISSASMTSGSVTFSSIPGTYKDLRLIIRNYQPTSDQPLFMRWNGVTGDFYRWQPSVTVDAVPFSADHIELSDIQDSAFNDFLASVNIYDYANTSTWKIGESLAFNNNAVTDDRLDWRKMFFGLNTNNAITSVTLYDLNATMTDGTIFLYGVN
jgi:hypothetical protein